MSLTRNVIVFNSNELVKFLEETFQDEFRGCTTYTIHPDRLSVKLNNGNCFTIVLDNDNQLIKLSVTRKNVYLKPHYEQTFYRLNFDIGYIIRKVVVPKFEELNNAAKMPIQTSTQVSSTYTTKDNI